MKFKVIDCCPVPAKLYPVLTQIKQEIGCTYNSVYRGKAKNAARYLTGAPPCYKHDQAWIFTHYPPGVANPPGRSTHELRNDGVAYPGPIGMPLRWWQCGLDIDDAHVAAFIRACAKHGWHAHITYPTSKVEYHHVNLTKRPILNLFKPLKKGSKGRRVRHLTWALSFIHSPVTHQPYLAKKQDFFDLHVEAALRRFQKEHHQKADGVFGVQTRKQLRASVRYRQQIVKGK